MTVQKNLEEINIWKILHEVKDPEVPVLSIIDLGIVRGITVPSPSPAKPERGRG